MPALYSGGSPEPGDRGKDFTAPYLTQAFQQLLLSHETMTIFTANPLKGLYKARHLPFGVEDALAILQRFICTTLLGISGTCACMGDIVVSGPTKEEHASSLEMVLNRLKTDNFRLNLGKRKLVVREVSFLGQKVNAAGIHKNRNEVCAIVVALPFPYP